MSVTTQPSIADLLSVSRSGDTQAVDALFALAYTQLRAIAQRQLGAESARSTITPTELVNEAFLKLSHGRVPELADRRHFFAICARAMRQILVERARARSAAKRDAGERVTLAFADAPTRTNDSELDLLALDQALDALAKFDQRKARAIELRVFSGLEFEEIAQLLEVSRATLARDYRAAQAYLRVAMDMAPAA